MISTVRMEQSRCVLYLRPQMESFMEPPGKEGQMTWEIPGGIIISLIYFLTFLTCAWKRYKKTLYQLPQRDKKMDVTELNAVADVMLADIRQFEYLLLFK